VLIDTGVLLDYRWHAMARRWRTPLLGELTMLLMALAPVKGFREAMNRGIPRKLPDAFLDRMRADMDAGTRRAVLKLYRATNDPAAISAALRERLLPLDRPALVVWGRHDAFIPAEQAERQREAFPRAEVHVLEDSGHWPFADDPARVDALVIDFLRKQVGAVHRAA
jgi:pimeloyl-ACP methyl ester carboxylesterase